MITLMDRLQLRNNPEAVLVVFMLVWMIINILQAGYTELLHDEAYYWVWSKELAWGYFDHPPLVALEIFFSKTLFSGELGVRLATVVTSCGFIYGLWKLVTPSYRTINYFILITAGTLFIHVYGFITTPDAPLMFFAVIYLLIYRRVLERLTIQNSLLWGLSMALVMYSKYHGLLLIIFSLIGHWAWLKKPGFYLAVFFGILLYSPHLIWQYEHDFPSLQYHLVDRGSKSINPVKVLANVLNPFYIIGPLVVYYFIATLRRSALTVFEKSLKWIFWGILGFFTVSSLTFKDSVYAQWLVLIIIPGVYFTYQWLNEHPEASKNFTRISVFTILIILLGRISLVSPFGPNNFEFRGNKLWVNELKKRAGYHRVVFENSYALASKYWFYSGDSAYTQCNARYRLSQYDLTGFEENYQHRPVLFIGNRYLEQVGGFQGISLPAGKKDSVWIKYYQNYSSANHLTLKVTNKPESAPGNDFIRVQALLMNPYNRTVEFENTEVRKNIYVQIYRKKIFVAEQEVTVTGLTSLGPLTSLPITLSFLLPPLSGDYLIRFVLRHDQVDGSALSTLYPLKINSK